MSRYVLIRAAHAILVVWAAVTATFWLLFLLPGDPALLILSSGSDNTTVDPAQLAALRADLGLDQPPLVRYVEQLGAVLRGDLGSSVVSNVPVVDSIAAALPHTLAVAAVALLLGIAAGSSLAYLSVFARSRTLRSLLAAIPPVAASVPTFWLGLVLLMVFSFGLRWLPAFGNDGPASLVLPAVTIAVPVAAVIAQVFGEGLARAWAEPFVTTSRAKGVGIRRIRLVEVVRNAAPASLTLVGMMLGGIVAGSVVVESVFSRAGVGQLVQQAVQNRDLPVIQGIVLLTSVSFVVASLAVDIAQAVLDPRIAQSTTSRRTA